MLHVLQEEQYNEGKRYFFYVREEHLAKIKDPKERRNVE
jgi:hypothetical protein